MTLKKKRPPLSPPTTGGGLVDKIRIHSVIPLLIQGGANYSEPKNLFMNWGGPLLPQEQVKVISRRIPEICIFLRTSLLITIQITAFAGMTLKRKDPLFLLLQQEEDSLIKLESIR